MARIRADEARLLGELEAERGPSLQSLRPDPRDLVCPVCERLLDTEHSVLVVGPVSGWSASHADEHRRTLYRIVLGLADMGEGWSVVCVARLLHWSFLQGQTAAGVA